MLKSYFVKDDAVEVGVDEAGRGSFWGPLMAGAVIWPYEDDWTEEHREIVPQIKDSKKIKPIKRDILSQHIYNLSVDCAVGTISAKEIDTYGISWANKQSFIRAINLLEIEANRILLDGILEIEYGDEDTEIINIIEGDNEYISIAAASILAKVEHDRWVTEYCVSNPEIANNYDLLNCKGYGTVKHRDGIYKYGLSEHHRQRFIHNKETRLYTTDSVIEKTNITDECLF